MFNSTKIFKYSGVEGVVDKINGENEQEFLLPIDEKNTKDIKPSEEDLGERR